MKQLERILQVVLLDVTQLRRCPAGVMDALTKVLVGLYEEPEKPSNALEFLKVLQHGSPDLP